MGCRDRALAPVAAAALLLGLTAAPAAAGSIGGRVVFRGDRPAAPPTPVAKDHEVCGPEVPSEALVVAPATGGVRQAVVFLEGVAPGGGEPPPGEVRLENRGCRFVPHVLALRVGAELAIVNDDPVLHNLRAWLPGRRGVFNVVQPTQGQVTRRTIKRAGVMTLTCDTHVHMLGYLLAFEHPYFAVTDASGAFRLVDVPPGPHRLTAWHEGWTVVRREPEGRPVYEPPRVLTREVVVPPSGEVRVQFDLTP